MSKKLVKDGLLLLIAKLVSIVSGTLIAIFVARYYGVNIYGQYTTAIAFSTFILTFTDLGLDTFMLKECSREKSKLNKYYGNVLLIKLLILIFSSILIIFLANNIGYSRDVVKLIIILIPNCVINYVINTFFVVMQIEDKLGTNAKIQILQSILIILVAISVMILGLNIYIYAILQSLISIVLILVYLRIIPVEFRATFRYTKLLLCGSIFFGLSSLLYIVYYKVDTVMLSLIKGTYEVGIYESAYKVVNILISLIVILDNLIMPKFFKLYKENKEKMIETYKIILNYAFVFGIPFSTSLVYMSSYIINILYGEQYHDAIFILQILIWTVSVRLLAATVGFVITASDNMKKKVKFQVIFAVLNIILNAILIPIYGVSGAAIATVITEIMVFITYYIFVRKMFNAKIKKSIILKCILMNILLAYILNYFKNLNFIVLGVICVLSYVFVEILFFRKDIKCIIMLLINGKKLKNKRYKYKH
ncbi:flippase [Clostridium perfringens]|uniref:flippase n=1 Tax=Clostridium perfringens TaxID=1502 RepID=UPI000D70F28B|nr:flippase [Clostridium perfringens]EGT3602713.1 flippase [Clostridium perfringens]EHR9038721.1 flippase [Clostridium perfringens]MDK0722131.1 flippase [Clostridium perfringens]MDK3121722.1 flippase [Clostridium perfringens]MDM0851335.1 flippase [Clostridium perfringens]